MGETTQQGRGVNPLPADQLYTKLDYSALSFETTDELPDLSEIVGQPRAVESVRFGIGINKDGYNIFALGPNGSGKKALITQFFEKQAKTENVPWDWCYVHNFEQDHRPKTISLPPGMGNQFRTDMEQLVEEVKSALSTTFESDEYRARRRVIEEEFQERQEKNLEEIQSQAKEHNLTMMRTPAGVVFAPVRDGEVISPEEFQKLSEDEQEKLQEIVEDLQKKLQKVLQTVPAWQRELRERIRKLNQEVTTLAVGGLLQELLQKFETFPDVVDYLNSVEKDIVENAQVFLKTEDLSGGENPENQLSAFMARLRQGPSPLRRFQVNVIVDNGSLEGAPVVFEDYPTFQNLIGRTEHMAQMGALLTDFTLIKPGALHRANGGYLILDVREVLLQPYAWDGLKRALNSRQIKIESIGEMLSIVSTVSLEPDPIPLKVKVALLGDRLLYYMLSSLDPDFEELFKVQADFEEHMPRNPNTQDDYARLVATIARKDNLKAFHRSAVSRIIEHASRLVGDVEKLSIRMRDISDLLREADFWAGQREYQTVQSEDVQKAINAQIYRADRLRERYQENILRDTILIDTKGHKVGQINGLSVIQPGNFAFAVPSRITARVRMGKGDVVNIEREVELSGPIHSKGVLILAGFLGARYSKDKPLSLSASLVFEQSYSGVDGDSASSAELYALLSAIAAVPINQSLAVTGSVNQYGFVQAIGGVNEKIEGFYDICNSRSLTGDQGVLIPASNVKHLMLREDVVESVRSGEFKIYPIEHVDQGIEVLTGLAAGEPDSEGNYPEGTINGIVQMRLDELAKKSARFGKNDAETDE
ncbi:MAG: AAA family ATPase [Anaerolineales bacterium]|nr:AAA family ATPase [Anaerolineales bacterium]